MVSENINPLLWFVCKFCLRAYQLRDDLVKHKRSNHLELFQEDLAAKRRAREGGVSAEASTDLTSPTSSSKSSVIYEDNSVESEESSTASPEIHPSANKPEEVSPLLLAILDDSIIESIPQAHENLTHSMEILNSAPPTGPTKSNQSTNEANESENKSKKQSHHWTSTPKPAGPPKSLQSPQDGDDSNSLDDFVPSSQTGRKLLKCDQCDRTFKQEQYRKLHITFAHDKNKSYPCQFCPKTFTHPRSRVFHVTKEHVDRMCRLTLAKSAEENSLDLASRTPKRGKKKPPARVHDLKKRPRLTPNSNDDHLSIGSNQSDGSSSNLYECDDCDDTFGSMSELCLHKSYHKRKSNV